MNVIATAKIIAVKIKLRDPPPTRVALVVLIAFLLIYCSGTQRTRSAAPRSGLWTKAMT
jgi:O-antigen ligase